MNRSLPRTGEEGHCGQHVLALSVRHGGIVLGGSQRGARSSPGDTASSSGLETVEQKGLGPGWRRGCVPGTLPERAPGRYPACDSRLCPSHIWRGTNGWRSQLGSNGQAPVPICDPAEGLDCPV